MQRPTHAAVVWWDDAWDSHGSATPKSDGPYPRVSSGLLIQDDEKGVCLAGTYDPPDKSIDGRTFIPRAVVRRLLRYKIQWGKK